MEAKEGASRSPVRSDGSPSMDSLHISQRDSSIKCSCPPGTKRESKDMIKICMGTTVTWYHTPCKPFVSSMSAPARTALQTLLRSTHSTVQASGHDRALPEKMLTIALGPNATEAQVQKARNISSEFRCDGPCRGSPDLEDYFWCYLCYAWQHKPCMLTDEGDRGRPVCNACHVHAMMHEDERDILQSRRLAQAAAEAFRFLRDSGNKGRTHQLVFAAKFLAAFLSKNRKKYLEFVVNRRRVARWIKARRGLPQPTYGDGSALPVTVRAYVATSTAGPGGIAPKKRKAVALGAQMSAKNGDGLHDDDYDAEFEYPDPNSIGGGKVKQDRKIVKKLRIIGPRRPMRESTAFEPLVLEQTAEDDAQYERMKKAAALKARKKTASAINPSLLEIETEDDFTPAPTAKPTRRASVPQWRASDEDEDFTDIGIVSTKQERNLAPFSRQNSRPTRKSAPSAGQLVEKDDEDEIIVAQPALKPRTKGTQRRIIEDDDEDIMPLQAAGRSSVRQVDEEEAQGAASEIICSCIGVSVSSIANCYQCRGCGLFEHTACASRDCKAAFLCKLCIRDGASVLPRPVMAAPMPQMHQTSTTPGAMPMAGYSTRSAPVEPLATAPLLPPSSVSTPRPPALRLEAGSTSQPQREPLSEAMQQEVSALCRTVLWNAYCDIPDPNDLDDRGSFDRPKLPPPSDWLAEAEKRVTLMFEVAGNDKVAEYLRHEFVQWPRSSLNIVKAMRDFAMWMRLKGPFRRTRRELGLVAEILGFEDKGTYWKPDQKDDAKEEIKN